MAKGYGETLAREVDLRIGAPVATTAVLTALPLEERGDDQLRMVTADGSLWRISATATTAVTASVLAFDSGAGRAIRVARAVPHEVRGVVSTNVADLTAFAVASNDGVTYVEGNDLLLANQSTGSQAGVYTVGAVAGGTAALTRVPGLAAGTVVKGGFTVHVSEGTLFANTSWFISTTGSITIGTTAHAWYPESVTYSQVLTAGTAAAKTTIPLLSATKSQVVYTRTTANTCSSTVSYQTVPAPTPGVSGTASIVAMATVAAGTINVADVSTLLVTVINR